MVGLPLVRNRYMLVSAKRYCYLRGIDFVIQLFINPFLRSPLLCKRPKKILISNTNHLGDVINATAVLAPLKHAYPDISIGFLVGSWASEILREHPLIDHVHELDLWQLNRSSISKKEKKKQYRKSYSKSLKEIRLLNYDTAIDLVYYYPNVVPFLWKTNIPQRLGYSSGGFSSLLTHSLNWSQSTGHLVSHFEKLLNILPSFKTSVSNDLLKPVLSPLKEIGALSKNYPILNKDYIIIHMGTGAPCREWPEENWCQLINKLHLHGYSIVLTGKGEREEKLILKAINNLHNCFNLCNRLIWDEFQTIMAKAKLLVCVNSLASHVAAIYDIPTVLIFAGTNNHHEWQPLNKSLRILRGPVPCAPCYKSQGCSTMNCMRLVNPEEVFKQCQIILEKQSDEFSNYLLI